MNIAAGVDKKSKKDENDVLFKYIHAIRSFLSSGSIDLYFEF